MSYLPTNLIDKTALRMDLISARQEALADNITNIDTPGYVRRDIEFSQYLNIIIKNLAKNFFRDFTVIRLRRCKYYRLV